jgi:isopropylmalate/homocitrate/citramalate synthase
MTSSKETSLFSNTYEWREDSIMEGGFMGNFGLRPDVIVEDTTLRDGEQAPGIALSALEKMEVCRELDLVGVPMIEVGTAGMGGEEESFIREACRAGFRARLVGWNRGKMEDLEHSLDCGLDAVHIGVPVSDIHLRASAKKNRDWLRHEIPRLIKFAKGNGQFVSISAEDASRSRPSDVIDYAKLVRDAGADRIRVSDTLGVFLPSEYHDLIGMIVSDVGIDVQIHVHNDLGLAMGNVVEGVRAGAKYVHATVNGWGERVGHPPLEAVVVCLKRTLGVETGVDFERLPALSAKVASVFRRDVPVWSPVVGRDVFTHESGIHAAGTLRDSESFEPFPADWLGRKHTVVAGKHSGSLGVQAVLSEVGIDAARTEVAEILPVVRQRAIELKRWLEPNEVAEIFAQRRVGHRSAQER